MKKNTLITVIIIVHIVFVFLQIHKHTLSIKNNYQQQVYEKKIIQLKEQKQLLTQELHALKNRDAIKKFAYNTLNMRPYSLSQIQKLPDYD